MSILLPNGVCLLASICNTTSNATPFTLWLARGASEYLVDLSTALGTPGDSGLTGLAWHDGTLYAAVQSGEAPRILQLDHSLTPIGAITAPMFTDLHSLHQTGDGMLVAATGTNTVLRLDLTARTVASLCSGSEKIHLNSACYDGDALLICYHRLVTEDRRLTAGGVLDTTTRRVLVDGLGLPHSLMSYRNGFVVLDSVGARVLRFDRSGVLAEQTLKGFPRGAAVAGNTLYVASSTLRYVSRSKPAPTPARTLWQVMAERVRIYALDAETLAVRAEYEPILPGFEIYELLVVPDDALDPPVERLLQPDRGAIAQLFYEANKRAGVDLSAKARGG